MIIRAARFNFYLLLAAALVLAVGCRSTQDQHQKQLATLRLHLEVSADGAESHQPVLVSRAQPEPVNVEKSPFLTEVDIAEVKVVEAVGGFALQVRFDQHGAWLLEQYSGGNPGRRFAIFSMFGEKPVQSRWIAAPVIPRRIADGTLVFTPDASREEAEQIAAGLNHLAHKTQPRSQ